MKMKIKDFNEDMDPIMEIEDEATEKFIPVISEEEAKDILKQERTEQEVENYNENEINWLDDDFYDSWDKVKGHFYNIIQPSPKTEFAKDFIPKIDKWFFLAHSNNTIRGKPQLIDQVQKKIPLIRLTSLIQKDKIENEEGKKETYEYRKAKYFFFDERYDKRYDGAMIDAFALDFWLYRIISKEGKEYYILSQEKLPNCTCNFEGMLVELDDFAEFSRNLKMKSLSRLFFMKEFEPDIKILTKEQLIQFTKERKLSEADWLNFLAYNPPLKNYNRFPNDVEMFRSSNVLSGKLHNYPNHTFIFGVAGMKKTMGHIETLAYKFEEEPDICEGGASRMKGLEPSFKEKPADIGYLAKKERFAFIDELGKMIEKMSEKDHKSPDNSLGSINFLLEHRKRKALSGNDSVEVQATAKNIFLTNPIANRSDVHEHVGLIDPSTLSRMLVWVQDRDEMDYVMSDKGIEEVPRTPTQEYTQQKEQSNVKEKEKRIKVLYKCYRKYIVENIPITRDEFLSLFDTCYNFTCEIDKEEVKRIVAGTTQLAREPMKSSVWKPRAYHHTYLMIDGLVKHRCLFRDYDPTFTPKQEDYDLAERILVRMVRGWNTNLAPKSEWGGF